MKLQSISTRIFKSYAIFMVISMAVLTTASLIFIGVVIKRDIINTQHQLLSNIEVNIENSFNEINDFSLMLSESADFRRISMQELPKGFIQEKNVVTDFRNLYILANKMFTKDYQVNIQLDNGCYIHMGSNYFIDFTNAPFKPGKLGEYSIKYLEKDLILAELLPTHPFNEVDLIPVISVIRPMNNNFTVYAPKTILSVQLPFDTFSRKMEQITKGGNMEVEIYSRDGSWLYGDKATDISKYIKEDGFNLGLFEEEGKTISVSSLQSSNLLLVVSYKTLELYGGLIIYCIIAFFILLGLILLLLILSYRISNSISSPVKILCEQISQTSWKADGIHELENKGNNIKEIDLLYDAINSMQRRLNSSFEENVVLRSYEIHSRMLALQAQIQPHFLYNTLTVLSSMLEEEDANGAKVVCNGLTRMFRYVSSGKPEGVALVEEIRYLNSYLDIMKQRFPEIDVKIEIPLEMMMLPIPKLIVQPLVENSLKYSDKSNCRIEILGEIIGEHWRIFVKDNGNGISNEVLYEIKERCRKAKSDYRNQNISIDGMGIVSVYIRLHLFYGDDGFFDIRNRDNQGCCVEIGGKMS